jgi:hypothetical protein
MLIRRLILFLWILAAGFALFEAFQYAGPALYVFQKCLATMQVQF